MFRSFARRYPSTLRLRYLAPATLAVTGLSGGSYLYIHAHSNSTDLEEFESSHLPARAPLSNLVRSYAVYTMCSVPVLVDSAPSILATLSNIPGIKQIAEAIVRRTFFRQFVGGESAHETIHALRELRNEHRGAMLSHSVEVDLAEAIGATDTTITTPSYKRNVEESIKAIEAAGDFEDEIQARSKETRLRRTTVAIKLTAMVPSPDVLTRFSTYLLRNKPAEAQNVYPGCTHDTDLAVLDTKSSPEGQLGLSDICVLSELRDDLIRLCTHAEQRGVRLMVDAEYTWFQPAIDAFAISMMRRFNRSKDGKVPQPLIYSTFQAYLKRTYPYLKKAMADAKAGGYTLGVKLVRGAYHPFELQSSNQQLSVSTDSSHLPPVFEHKEETDICYNKCVHLLLESIATGMRKGQPHVGVLFGTHNWTSAKLVLKTLVEQGLATVAQSGTPEDDLRIKVREEVVAQVSVGQLYGMCEGLTQYLVEHIDSQTPMIIKCVPYGVLSEVMPYLGRRAIENKSVLGGPGGATDERRRVGRELRSRIFG